jgi:hypothetical protein
VTTIKLSRFAPFSSTNPNPPPERASASVASSWSSAAGAARGLSASTAGCLLAGLGGSLYHSPSSLEVGHVGLVGELVQVREPRGGDSLRDSLGTRIEKAVHVGAHGKQALHVCNEVFG